MATAENIFFPSFSVQSPKAALRLVQGTPLSASLQETSDVHEPKKSKRMLSKTLSVQNVQPKSNDDLLAELLTEILLTSVGLRQDASQAGQLRANAQLKDSVTQMLQKLQAQYPKLFKIIGIGSDGSTPAVFIQENAPPVAKKNPSPKEAVQIAPTYKSAPEVDDYLHKLAAYMNKVLLLSVQLSDHQAQVSELQTNQGQKFIEEAKVLAKKIEDAIAAYEAAVAKAAHESWIQKIVSGVAGGLMILLGALLAQPELALAGAFMLIMNTIPMDKNGDTGSTLLNNSLSSLSPVAKIFADIGIDVAMAIVMCGVGGALNAAASGAEEAGAAAAEQASFAARAAELGFSNGQFLAQFAQMTMIANPVTDILKAAGVKSETAQWIGMAVAFAFAFVASIKAINPDSFGAKMEQSMVKSSTYYQNLMKFLQFAKFALGMTSAGFGIKAGMEILHQADIVREMGGIRASQAVIQAALSMNNANIQESQDAANAVAQNLTSMNSRWDAYVAPYAMAAEIMG